MFLSRKNGYRHKNLNLFLQIPNVFNLSNNMMHQTKCYYYRSIPLALMEAARSVNKRLKFQLEMERVRVIVRCRPMNLKEIRNGYYKVVDVQPFAREVRIFNPKEDDTEYKTFTFDAVYDDDSTQEELYIESVQPVVESVLNGFNATIFAYGQTGTGKTFTMEGNQLDPSSKGVIPKSFEQIFNCIATTKNVQYLVSVSYIEIYNEQIKDLLDGNGKMCYELRGDDSGGMIKNLKSYVCRSVAEMENVMKHGNRNRKIGMTNMNDHSSRSHAIFIITIEMSKFIGGINHVTVSKLNLVDLAGSERQSKSCANSERLKEACKINLSLSALGKVITALSKRKCLHIPYRDSKLTRLLQDSLGGNSKTLMIANIGPANYNYDESLTTLRYANQAKNIKNRPQLNENPKDALIRQYQNEIRRLKALVHSKNSTLTKNITLCNNNNNYNNTTITTSTTNNNKNENNTRQINNKKYINSTNQRIKTQTDNVSLSDDDKTRRLMEEVKMKQLHLQEEKKKTEILKEKINEMERKILNSNLYVPRQENLVLKAKMKELEERKKRKQQLLETIRMYDEKNEKLEEKHFKIKCENEMRKKAINETLSKIQKIKEETRDKIKYYNRTCDEMHKEQHNLIKTYKINQIIIENFIPLSERKKFVINALSSKNRCN